MTTEPALPQLSPEERMFLDILLAQVKRDQAAAYAKAFGCSLKLAAVRATRLLKRKDIKDEIARMRKELMGHLHLNTNDLLKELRSVIVADPRELMEYRRGACRYCHGFDYRYMRTPAEYRADLAAYHAENLRAHKDPKRKTPLDPLGALFDPQGGVGFNPTLKPDKDCPECFGQGQGYSYIKDSRTVSKAAARLFMGVKETGTGGIEIKTRPTDKSVELLMRHLGMLDPDREDGKQTAEQKAAAVRALLEQAGATVGKPAK